MACGCERNCTNCLNKLCTRGIPIFSSLQREQLLKISGMTEHPVYEKGAVILAQDSHPDYVAIVSQGSVKASRYTSDGREQILYVFSEGDFFGEQNLLFDKPASYNVIALEQVALCLLHKGDFLSLLRDNPDIAVKIVAELGWRLMHLENAVQNMGVRSLEARINAALLELAGKYGVAQQDGVLLRMPLSREGLANYIGVARETVSRKLGALESEGVIRSVNNKTLLIKDLGLLEEQSI